MWACCASFDFNRMSALWWKQVSGKRHATNIKLQKHPECFISTELSQ